MERQGEFIPLDRAFSNSKEKAVKFEAEINFNRKPEGDTEKTFKIGHLKVHTVQVDGERWLTAE